MFENFPLLWEVVWPLALALAWLCGEIAHRFLSLPRISSYCLCGFVFASMGFLQGTDRAMVGLIANFGFSLFLFELGHCVNLSWLKTNLWVSLSSVVQALGTFLIVLLIARSFKADLISASMLATLTMATSPTEVLTVARDVRSSGQMTERLLHLCAFNCALAIIVFKILLAYWLWSRNITIPVLLWHSFASMAISVFIGAAFGLVVPWLLALIQHDEYQVVPALIIALLVLLVITHAFQLSPMLAALSFGLMSRHRRVVLTREQRHLGNILTIPLLLFIASSLSWTQVVAGSALALIIIFARLLVQSSAITLFARPSGITFSKALLMGLAMMPLATFAILFFEEHRFLFGNAGDSAPVVAQTLAALGLLLGIIGPIATQCALMWSKEALVQSKLPR